jgi:hypothetical protein
MCASLDVEAGAPIPIFKKYMVFYLIISLAIITYCFELFFEMVVRVPFPFKVFVLQKSSEF